MSGDGVVGWNATLTRSRKMQREIWCGISNSASICERSLFRVPYLFS